MPEYAQGRFGQAFQFNGTNQSVSIPNVHADLNGWTQFTLEAWVYLDNTNDGTGGGQAIFSKIGDGREPEPDLGYQFGFGHGSTKLSCQFNISGQPWPGFVTGAELGGPAPTNTWLHVAASYDHNAVKIYYNGAPLVTNVIGPATIVDCAASLRLNGDDNANVFFAGRIDDARIYNRALSATEIASLAGEPQGSVDFSDDFSSGVNSNLWVVGSTDPRYSLDASQGDIRFSRQAGGDYTIQTMVLALDREVRGDFDASIEFGNASINRVDGSPGNQVQLVASFGGQAIVVVRSDEAGHGHNAHIWRNPPAVISKPTVSCPSPCACKQSGRRETPFSFACSTPRPAPGTGSNTHPCCQPRAFGVCGVKSQEAPSQPLLLPGT